MHPDGTFFSSKDCILAVPPTIGKMGRPQKPLCVPRTSEKCQEESSVSGNRKEDTDVFLAELSFARSHAAKTKPEVLNPLFDTMTFIIYGSL